MQCCITAATKGSSTPEIGEKAAKKKKQEELNIWKTVKEELSEDDCDEASTLLNDRLFGKADDKVMGFKGQLKLIKWLLKEKMLSKITLDPGIIQHINWEYDNEEEDAIDGTLRNCLIKAKANCVRKNMMSANDVKIKFKNDPNAPKNAQDKEDEAKQKEEEEKKRKAKPPSGSPRRSPRKNKRDDDDDNTGNGDGNQGDGDGGGNQDNERKDNTRDSNNNNENTNESESNNQEEETPPVFDSDMEAFGTIAHNISVISDENDDDNMSVLSETGIFDDSYQEAHIDDPKRFFPVTNTHMIDSFAFDNEAFEPYFLKIIK
jgi:hypothetical protein